MKKIAFFSVIIVFVVAALTYLAMHRTGDQQTGSGDSYYADVRGYILKNNGKVPRKHRRPNEWYYVQRAYPNSSIPAGLQLAAIETAREQRDFFATQKNAALSVWQSAGPTNIPGRITDLAVNPASITTVYAASASGGIFKTVNAGNSWTPVFDDAGSQSMGAIAMHPTNPDILYAGTGEANGAGSTFDGTGIYKTTDAGSTWEFKGLPNSYHIGRIVFDPNRPETVFVAVMGKLFGSNPDRGVYRTTDGGNTWEQKLYVADSAGCIDVALHPSTGTLIACMWERIRDPARRKIGGVESGVYMSTDAGDNWVLISGTNGLPAQSPYVGRIGVTMDSLSNTAYLLFSDSDGIFTGVYKTTNMGGSWARVDNGSLNDLNGSWNGGWYFGNIRVAQGRPDLVFALGLELYRSTDGGVSWSSIIDIQHVDFHALYSVPGSGATYSGNDGGVYLSFNDGTDWALRHHMPNTQFYAIEVDPANPLRLFGGAQDNGTMGTYSGSADNWTPILGGDGFYVQIDYSNSNIMYAEYQNGVLYKSTDGGSSFSYALSGVDYYNERHNWSTPVVLDPVNPEILYYGSNYLYRTVDAAGSWDKVSGDLTNGPHEGNLGLGTISTIDVSPANTDIIWVGTDDANVYVTTDGGSNWLPRHASLPDRWVTRVTADYTDAAVAYVTLSGYQEGSYDAHIYRTTDYGQTWTDIQGNLPEAPINDVIVDFHDGNYLYAGTDVGVYQTSDLGGTWVPIDQGMPIVPVLDLDFHVSSRTLVAGTHGRSMYKTILACPDENDTDGDGIADLCDNCPATENPDQGDADADGFGDACDECTDRDSDGFGDPGYPANICAEDNCPDVYNPDQADLDGDGIGNACDFRALARDSITTDCLGLTVSNNGNLANRGDDGYTLDYSLSGDCDPSASIYAYDGGPILCYINDLGDTVAYIPLFGRQPFLLVDGHRPTIPVQTTEEYDKYETGTFATPDSNIAVEIDWYAPKAPDTCNFVIQHMRVYPFDGLSHGGLKIGQVIDWDVPSDYGADNEGGTNSTYHLVYQLGIEADYVGCQLSYERLAGMAFLGSYVNDETGFTAGHPYAAYVESNPLYIWPSSGFIPGELYLLMQRPGYNVYSGYEDIHSTMVYVNDYTLGFEDTLNLFTTMSTVMQGNTANLIDNIEKAQQWLNDHIVQSAYLCGDANSDADVNISDAVFLVEYIFKGGPPPNPEAAGDVDCTGTVNVADAVYVINYIFKGGPAPCASCK